MRVAAIAMGVVAALLLTNGALLWSGFDDAVDRVAEAAEVGRDAARQFVLSSLIPNVVLGLVLALSAWFFPRRQPWARWTGLAASGLLVVLTLFQLVAGDITIASLLLLALSIAAVAGLLARGTREWVPPLRSAG
ncbi:hypothetical protein SAMN05216574_11740 [Blastococcus tunisiensis]|uniref:Uncharacterized protein n=1 Tax=Blastococcus tunisiensis TaxID=1798228 RepID=A0A1I2JQX9_9ACTN|nr:hypothetical protein SAMN05216574_11740 [Blastococcus sp. DSM 46838]